MSFTWIPWHTNANRLKWVSQDVCLTNNMHTHSYRENRGKERIAEGREGARPQSLKKQPRNRSQIAFCHTMQ